jgi:hypothetical protein
MQFNNKRKFSKERYEKLFLYRDIWNSKIQLSYEKKVKGLKEPEPVSEEKARKLVQDIGQSLLLFIGGIFTKLILRKELC